MTLDEVEYKKCEQCGRAYPMAHIKEAGKHPIGEDPPPDEFIKHDNPSCIPCIRKLIRSVKTTNKASLILMLPKGE